MYEWQKAPHKPYVPAAANNLGYPVRIQAQKKHQEDLAHTKDIWSKTKQILQLKNKLQNELKIVVNEDTLIPTLRETE